MKLEPDAEQALEALHILAGQCGRPKIRTDNKKIIEAYIRTWERRVKQKKKTRRS